MKRLARLSLLVVLTLTWSVSVQTVSLTGRILDPNGAVIQGIEVEASSIRKELIKTQTNSEGEYSLSLLPGQYSISVNRQPVRMNGFETLVLSKYRVGNALDGKMNLDLVLTGSNDHEPCGYGGDCGSTEQIETSNDPQPQDKIYPRPKIEENKQKTKVNINTTIKRDN